MKNKKIDAAVFGLGYMGSTHVRAAKDSPYINRIYGYEPDEEFAQSRGKELRIKGTSNLNRILNNPEIKLIYIASVNSTHSELAQKALRAGKSVLCEKPMGETLEEARSLIEAEEETGNFLQIGFEMHYSKLYMKAKEWIDQGLIGDPVNCHIRYYSSEFHKKNTWRSNSPGSLIGEKLSHYLDMQRWVLGSEVEDVYSLSSPNVVKYFNHPDNHQINMRFKNNAVSSLNFLMYIGETDPTDPFLEMLEKQKDDGHSLQVHIMGTRGAIETDVFERRIRRWEFGENEIQFTSRIVETIRYKPEDDFEWMHNAYGQNLRIAELVANGKKPEVSAHDAFRSMQVGFAAELSEKEKRIVKISEL